MIEIIEQYDLWSTFADTKATKARLNDLLADGYKIIATLPGWGYSEDSHTDGLLILYKPDEPAAQPDTALAEDELPHLLDMGVDDFIEATEPDPEPEPAEERPAVYPRTLDGFKRMVADGDYVILDTETTGLHDGEICQIAIIDGATGNMLLNTYVQTVQPIPESAARIHGITDEKVANAPTWAEIQPKARELLRGRHVVIYNAVYDRKMMHKSDERSGLPRVDYKAEAAKYWCAMEYYAEYVGNWSDYHQSYRWVKLTEAAAREGVSTHNAHDAYADCRMTWGVIRSMAGLVGQPAPGSLLADAE